jgi:hypothetical protein
VIEFPPLLISASVFALLHNMWALLNALWSVRFIRQRIDTTYDQVPSTKFLILLPMFDEAAIANDTIDHFRSLSYPTELLTLAIITTAQECAIDHAPTTAECVRTRLKNIGNIGPRILHIHVQSGDSCKARQINSALAILRDQRDASIHPESIIGVYDADSRPDRRVLQEVDAESTRRPDIEAFQQGASYFSNFDTLPTGLRGMYLRARPFYNLRFCFFRELPGFARSVKAMKSGLIARCLLCGPNHFLGHGEFIRLRTLDRFGGFPSPSVDTSLGNMLSFAGYAIAPLGTMDKAETPPSLRALFLQGIVWYSDCASYWKDLKRVLPPGVWPNPVQMTMVLRRWLDNMIWCLGPIALLVTMMFAVVLQVTTALEIGIAACFLHAATILCSVYPWQSVRHSQAVGIPLRFRENPFYLALILVSYPVMLLGSCLSPISYYLLLVRQKLFGKVVPRAKTPHGPNSNRPA